MGRGGARTFKIKSCGKRHAYCKQCNPKQAASVARAIKKFNINGHGILSHKKDCSCGWCLPLPIGRVAGDKNPNWRGGASPKFGPGWKAARREVWKRDKVCRVCGLPPYSNRRLDIHHILERRNGGGIELNNLAGLHHGCHMKVHFGKMSIMAL